MGLYGGFIQAGVGFIVLALTTAGGLDLIRGNAVKVTVIAAGFDRIDAGSSLLGERPSTRITELFAEPEADDDHDDDDDDFDVPSFLK